MSKGYTGETKSYPGQSDESYCAECLVTHYSTALGLLDEAERLSQREEMLNQESLNRISEAMREMLASLYDLGMVDRPWTEEFRVGVRRVRKKYLLPLLAMPWRKDLLPEAIREVKKLYDLALKVLRDEAVREQYRDVEEELVRRLTYFINLGEMAHLEKAVELSYRSKCTICVEYATKAYEAAKKGDMEKARELANILRLGIEKWMKELAEKSNITDEGDSGDRHE